MTQRKKRVFDNNLKNAYEVDIVQRATRGIYCKKRDKTVKSMKKFRRHLKNGHQTVKKSTCNSRDDMLNRRTDSRVHVHKFHEHDNNDEEENKLGLSWAKLSTSWGLKLEFEGEV